MSIRSLKVEFALNFANFKLLQVLSSLFIASTRINESPHWTRRTRFVDTAESSNSTHFRWKEFEIQLNNHWKHKS